MGVYYIRIRNTLEGIPVMGGGSGRSERGVRAEVGVYIIIRIRITLEGIPLIIM